MIAVTMNNRKSLNESTNKIIILLNIISLVAGILLQRNEIFFDDWYIESIADGTFGESNIAFSTIGANQFFTFLIYLLSRINSHICWINIISLVSIFISNLIITNVIYSRKNNIIGYYICIIYLLAVLPITVFYMQFTTTSALIAASGAILLFTRTKSCDIKVYGFKPILWPSAWVLFGCSMRFDAIFFASAIVGTLVLFRLIKDVHNKQNIKVAFLVEFLPFACLIMLCFVIEGAHQYILNYCNPAFGDWNEARSKIDDYPLPNYNNTTKSYYSELGLSANDIELIQSWNDYDPEFITKDLLVSLLPTVRTSINKQNTVYDLPSIFNSYYWLIFILAILYLFALKDWSKFLDAIAVGAVTILLVFYFIQRGRLIWRTEWPIYSTGLMCLAFLCSAANERKDRNSITSMVLSITIISFFALVFINPCNGNRPSWTPYNGESLGRVYWHRMKSDDTFGRYIVCCINGSKNIDYETFDVQTTQYCIDNKDKLFYVLFSPVWLQEDPSTNVNLYISGGTGSSENRFSLGQYCAYLNPQRSMLESYGITNPVKQLIDGRVYVISYSMYLPNQAKILRNYLDEHYYDNVDFGIVNFLDRTSVGQFYISTQINDSYYAPASGSLILLKSEYEGYLKLEVALNDNEDNFDSVSIVGTDGQSHTFPVIYRGDDAFVYCLDDTFKIGDKVSVYIEIDGNRYKFDGALNLNK